MKESLLIFIKSCILFDLSLFFVFAKIKVEQPFNIEDPFKKLLQSIFKKNKQIIHSFPLHFPTLSAIFRMHDQYFTSVS